MAVPILFIIMSTPTLKRQQLASEVDMCLDLVSSLTSRLSENRKRLTEIRSIKVEHEPQPIRTAESQQSLMRINSRLNNIYRMNFPISPADADFLSKRFGDAVK